MKYILIKKISLFLISFVLVCGLSFAPLSSVFTPQKTEAFDIVSDPWNTIQGTISAVADVASQLSLGSLVTKEYVLDTIAWGLINVTLETMLQSTTDWINSGFEGKPAFVQNMQSYLLDIADTYALGFIFGKNLDFLCSPFKLDIQFALEANYANTREYYAQCRITDAITNLSGFLDGDFIGGGGWDAWYDITLNPHMYPAGALFLAEGSMHMGLSNAREGGIFEVNIGQGFLSKKTCETNVDGTEECSIVTPGQTIQERLETALNIPTNRLEIADELNELLGALFVQVGKQVLSGAGGLLGLTNSYDSSGNNYFDRMQAEQVPVMDQNATSDIYQIPTQGEYIQETSSINTQLQRTSQQIQLYSEVVSLIETCEPSARTTELDNTLTETNKLIQDTTYAVSQVTNLYNQLIANYTTALETETLNTIKAYQDDGTFLTSQALYTYQWQTIPAIEADVRALPDSAGCAI